MTTPSRKPPRAYIRWGPVMVEAVRLANRATIEVGQPPTLRQVHYMLVAAFGEGRVPFYVNDQNAYKRLSELTSRGREDGTFPRLTDLTRSIEVAPAWDSVDELIEWGIRTYRRDRTEGQDYNIIVTVEKATLQVLVSNLLWDRGIPVAVLRGQSGTEMVRDLAERIDEDGRPAVLLHVGDLDPTGWSIPAVVVRRLPLFGAPPLADFQRVAVLIDHLAPISAGGYGLPMQRGKVKDPNAPEFIREFGPFDSTEPDVPFQVEVEALPPATLRDLINAAVADWWDDDTHEAVREREDGERENARKKFAT